MIGRIFDSKKNVHKALEASWLRNEVITQNISNADTPGYKKLNVSFEEQLSKAMDASRFHGKKTHEKHITIGGDKVDDVKISVSKDHKDTSMRIDGNNVDIDKEMTELSKNNILYNALVKQAGYGSLRKVLTDTK